MKKIVSIRKARKYYHVDFDDNTKIVVTEDTLLDYALAKGKTFSDSDIEEIERFNGKSMALLKAVSYLGYGMRTEKQIKDKLAEKGIDKESIDYAVSKLSDYSYIDDTEYAFRYSQQYSNKYGPRKIEMKLRQKGIKAELAKSAAESIPAEDEEAAAMKHIERIRRRYPDLDTRSLNRKIYEALTRNGFKWSNVSHLLKDTDDYS